MQLNILLFAISSTLIAEPFNIFFTRHLFKNLNKINGQILVNLHALNK